MDGVTSSRNCDTSDEEDAMRASKDADTPPLFRWLDAGAAPSSAPTPCRLLVVGAPGCGCMFLRSMYPHTARASVAKVDVVGKGKRGPKHPSATGQTDGTCTLALGASGDASGVVFVFVQADVPAERAAAVAKCVFAQFAPERVAVFDTVSSMEVVLSDSKLVEDALEAPPPILRILSTAATDADDVASLRPLEAPNLVKGLSAAVMTHCQVFGLPAVAFVAVEGHRVSVEALRAMLPGVDVLRAWADAAAPSTKDDSVEEAFRQASRDAAVSSSRTRGLMFL